MVLVILLAVSAVVALSLGVSAFRGGIQISGRSQHRLTGIPAKVIGAVCLFYGLGVLVTVGVMVLLMSR